MSVAIIPKACLWPKIWANHIHPYLTKLLASTRSVLSFDCYCKKRKIGKPDNCILVAIHICDDDRMPSNLYYWMLICFMKYRYWNRKKSAISELYSLDHEGSGTLNEQFDKSWNLGGWWSTFFRLVEVVLRLGVCWWTHPISEPKTSPRIPKVLEM